MYTKAVEKIKYYNMHIFEIHKEKIERMMQKTYVNKLQLTSNIQGRDQVTNLRKLRKHKVE